VTTERGARGWYVVAVVVAVVGLVLGVISVTMGHALEGLLTVIGFGLLAAFFAGITTWAKRADRAKAAQRQGGDDGSRRG
jgi:predicted lipid-binding transport protein (Tim44 family)